MSNKPEELGQLQEKHDKVCQELEATKGQLLENQKERDEVKSELHDVREELERTQSQMDEILGELEQTHFELHQLKEKGEVKEVESSGELEKELEETKAKLEQRQSDLGNVREELERTQSQLDEVLGELEQTHFELHQLKEKGEVKEVESGGELEKELEETNAKLEKTHLDLGNVTDELERTQSQLDEVLEELEQTHFELHQLKEKRSELESLEKTKIKLRETEELLERSQSQLGETMEVLEEYKSQMEETMGVLENSQEKLQQKHQELERVKAQLRQKQLGSELKVKKELKETKSQLRETEELLENSQFQLGETMEVLEEYRSQLEKTMAALEQSQSQSQLKHKEEAPKQLKNQPDTQKQRKTSRQELQQPNRVFEIENAVVKRIEIVNHHEWLGGLVCSQEMPGIFRHRRAAQEGKLVYLDNNKPEKSTETLKNDSTFYSGTYIYGGCFYPHFGHALTESIHRLWAFNNTVHEGIVFAVALPGQKNASLPAYTPPEWFAQILELLEIPLAKCIWVTDACMFEKLVIPEPGSELTLGAKAWYSSYLEKLQQRIFKLTDNLKKQDLKIFLGRTHLLMNGSVAGENYLEKLLVDEGYISLDPENYNFIQQLAYLIGSKKIIFTEGSAIYSLELINYLDADICCIPRRADNKLFQPHLKSKCRSYIIAGNAENCMRLGAYNMKDGPNSISISKEPFQIVESLRNNHFALLKNWNQEEFLACEKSDVTKYINNGTALLKGGNQAYCLGIMEKYSQVRPQSIIESNNHPVSQTSSNMELKHRHARLNKLASINQSSRYLEIGVSEGQTFNAIDIENKVAVDVKFQFNYQKCATDKVIFFEVSSDEFFRSHCQQFLPFDLIYLDGLHTFEQTFRDFCASLSCGHSRTIWLIDDTCPGSYAQAQPSHQLCQKLKRISGEKNKSWMGDVFKVIAAINDFFPQFSFATFPDHGQTVVWKKWRTDFKPQWNSLERISRLEYSDLVELQDTLFKRKSYNDIFETISNNLKQS